MISTMEDKNLALGSTNDEESRSRLPKNCSYTNIAIGTNISQQTNILENLKEAHMSSPISKHLICSTMNHPFLLVM